MTLKDSLIELSKGFPEAFKEQRDGLLLMQFVIGE